MTPLTLFSWGYWDSGNATRELVRGVDAVEAPRGFQPPVFVDARFSRSVRAQGFQGNAFGEVLGLKRYKWMQGLRNESVKTRSTKVKIHDHAAIDELLDMATTLARDNRRLLFFCSCKAGRLRACHRFQITQMLYESSRRFSSPIVVDEWPGGRPSEFELPVSKEVFAKVSHGNLKQVPLGQQVDLQHFAGLAWCSVALLSSAA